MISLPWAFVCAASNFKKTCCFANNKLCTPLITSSVIIGYNGACRGAIFVATLFDVKPSTFIFIAYVVGWWLRARLEGKWGTCNKLEGVVAPLLKFGMLEGKTSWLKLVTVELFLNLKPQEEDFVMCGVNILEVASSFLVMFSLNFQDVIFFVHEICIRSPIHMNAFVFNHYSMNKLQW